MKEWFKLFFFLLLIWGFVQLVPTFLNKIPSYKDVINNSVSLDIDNAALFYTEEPLTSSAEMELSERLNSLQE